MRKKNAARGTLRGWSLKDRLRNKRLISNILHYVTLKPSETFGSEQRVLWFKTSQCNAWCIQRYSKRVRMREHSHVGLLLVSRRFIERRRLVVRLDLDIGDTTRPTPLHYRVE